MTLTAAQSNLELLKSGLFSDFTIECRGSEFKVHKAIICPCSDFFKAACNPNFEVQHPVLLSQCTDAFG